MCEILTSCKGGLQIIQQLHDLNHDYIKFLTKQHINTMLLECLINTGNINVIIEILDSRFRSFVTPYIYTIISIAEKILHAGYYLNRNNVKDSVIVKIFSIEPRISKDDYDVLKEHREMVVDNERIRFRNYPRRVRNHSIIFSDDNELKFEVIDHYIPDSSEIPKKMDQYMIRIPVLGQLYDDEDDNVAILKDVDKALCDVNKQPNCSSTHTLSDTSDDDTSNDDTSNDDTSDGDTSDNDTSDPTLDLNLEHIPEIKKPIKVIRR